ncbi:MAG: MFS transporter [Coriobacteriia bacterium]|nr:MFS transporter [Coriobacteriia bacterium]
MTLTSDQRRVVGVYLTTSGLFTLATSLIWAVNTLFLLGAGLDIFQVMLVNTTYTVGQIVFEVPTGVIADTVGRKASLLLGIGTLLLSTLLYVAGATAAWGMPAFLAASVLLGLGYTFQTGAADAWLVDALDHAGWPGGKERVFAWGQMTFGSAMLAGTLLGGALGQMNLAFPYYARSGILALCFLATMLMLRDWGFTPRPLRASNFAEETRAILTAGVRYGWRDPVVRPLLFVSLIQGVFFMFAFYTSQPFFLELLGMQLIWVVAAVQAASAVVGIVGNSLVDRVMRAGDRRRRAGVVLAVITVAQGLLALAIASVGLLVPVAQRGVPVFAAAAVLWLLFSGLMGVGGPVRQAFINEQIPSAQRATVLSVDALFGDVGGSVGQPALGYLAKAVSIPAGWAVGAIALLVSSPLYLTADRHVATRPSAGE